MQQKPKICHEKTAIAHALLAPHPRQGTRALPYKMLGCRAGPMCPAAHRTSCTPSVGADASVRAPMLYRTSCKRCHCETSSQTGRGERAERCQWQKKRGERVAAVKISSVRRKAAQKFWAPQQGHPPPVPSAPLPKGGWHGKAVTGGFYTSPHLLQPFRRGGVLLPTVVPTD